MSKDDPFFPVRNAARGIFWLVIGPIWLTCVAFGIILVSAGRIVFFTGQMMFFGLGALAYIVGGSAVLLYILLHAINSIFPMSPQTMIAGFHAAWALSSAVIILWLIWKSQELAIELWQEFLELIKKERSLLAKAGPPLWELFEVPLDIYRRGFIEAGLRIWDTYRHQNW